MFFEIYLRQRVDEGALCRAAAAAYQVPLDRVRVWPDDIAENHLTLLLRDLPHVTVIEVCLPAGSELSTVARRDAAGVIAAELAVSVLDDFSLPQFSYYRTFEVFPDGRMAVTWDEELPPDGEWGFAEVPVRAEEAVGTWLDSGRSFLDVPEPRRLADGTIVLVEMTESNGLDRRVWRSVDDYLSGRSERPDSQGMILSGGRMVSVLAPETSQVSMVEIKEETDWPAELFSPVAS